MLTHFLRCFFQHLLLLLPTFFRGLGDCVGLESVSPLGLGPWQKRGGMKEGPLCYGYPSRVGR